MGIGVSFTFRVFMHSVTWSTDMVNSRRVSLVGWRSGCWRGEVHSFGSGGVDNLGSDRWGAHLCIGGEKHVGSSGEILRNEFVIDTIHLIALPHLFILQSSQLVYIFGFSALLILMLALIILRNLFSGRREGIVIHKGYFDVIGCWYSSWSWFWLYLRLLSNSLFLVWFVISCKRIMGMGSGVNWRAGVLVSNLIIYVVLRVVFLLGGVCHSHPMGIRWRWIVVGVYVLTFFKFYEFKSGVIHNSILNLIILSWLPRRSHPMWAPHLLIPTTSRTSDLIFLLVDDFTLRKGDNWWQSILILDYG